MASVNKVILVGNCGADPEIRFLPSGSATCTVSLATTDRWKDKQSGEMKEHTEWHRLSFFDRLAEIVGDYVKKGSQIYVEGSLRTRKYTDQQGVEKYSTEVRVSELKLLGKREDGGGEQREGSRAFGRSPAPAPAPAPARAPAPAAQRRPAPAGGGSGFDDMDDDIPF